MAKILLNVEINNALAKKQLSELEKTIETIASSLNKVKVNKDLSAQINSLTKYYKAVAKAATSATTATEKRRLSEQKLATEVKRTLTQAEKERAATANAEKAVVSLTKAKMQLAQASEKAANATKQDTKAIEENTEANEKQTQSIFSMAKGFAEWQVAAALVMRPLNLLRFAVQDIGNTLVETEDRVIELKRVLSENIPNKQISDQLYKIAQQYGQTFDNVSEIALNFARAGMSWAETIQATEAAVLALNVAELDASEASDGLISIMNQFGLEANELTLVIDKLNKTADNFPVTTEKILSALQRTGSAAKNANLDLDETVSLVTALSKATNRSGENIGTALNSLIQFSTKDTALDTFAQLGGGVQTAVENYRKGAGDVLDIWRELSTVIQSRNNSSQNILGGLFGDDDWRSLNEELQDALGENFATVTEIYDTASTFRKNYFIALLDNMDTVEEAMKVMDDAAGYSAKENEQYLDTYTAKVNTLKTKWEELANDEQGLLGLKKTLVDIGINVLELVDKLGGLIPTLRTIAILVGTIVAIAKFDAIDTKIASIATTIKSLVETSKTAKQGVDSLAAATKLASLAAKSALGIIGLVLAAVSVGVGLWQKYNQEQAEAREQAIQTWEAHKEEAKSLDELLEKYKSYTDYASTEAKQTEKELISLLGEKVNVLSDLTEDTDEYREALINLSEKEKEIYLAEQTAALSAAKTNLGKAHIERKFIGQNLLLQNGMSNVLSNAGVELDYFGSGVTTNFSIKGLSSKKDAESQLRNYQILQEVYEKLIVELNKATRARNQEYIDEVSTVFSKVSAALNEAKGSVTDYENALKAVKNATDAANNATDDLADTVQDLSAASDSKIKSLLEKLTAQRDAIKSAHDEEEKRKAVLEAENKLLDAQNDKIKAQKQLLEAMENRNVRVYNAQTGLWEWNANAKTVENAKEQVEKAQENIEKAQEDLDKARYNAEIAAYDEIIKYLENGGRDIDELKKIFEKWQETYNGTLLEGEPKFLTDIMEAFEAVKISLKKITGEDKEEEKKPEKKPTTSNTTNTIKPKKDPPKIDFGVDNWGISTPTIKGSLPNTKRSDYIYDNGGILEGMGGIKATSRPEMVLPPEITEKLLEPTNNERFKNIAKAMGIMIHDPFQSLQPIDTRNIIRNYGGNTDNRNYDNRNYHINGVPISTQMAETHTLKEIIDCFSLIPND